MTSKGPIRIERLIVLFLIGAFLVYGLFEAYKLISGPKIEIISPTPGSTITEASVVIEGRARNVSFISLNDRQIFIDDQGIFREKLLLPAGYTIIKVGAEDRFKKRVEKRIPLWRPLDAKKDFLIETEDVSTTTATSTASSTIDSLLF
ncbi:MAG TPA: hypothetical protein VEC13_02215 [Candidatus Paceibacterota bacterium]|nr:hypothetical protein [Candidatus Paceibacterota bacterium]